MSSDLVPSGQAPSLAIDDALPMWLKFILGNYADSWPSEYTWLVLESEFSQINPQLMLEAARAYCRENKRFPNIATLLPYVQRLLQPDPLQDHIQAMGRLRWTLVSDQGGELLFEHADGRQTVHYH